MAGRYTEGDKMIQKSRDLGLTTRRGLLTGAFNTDTGHIASLYVQAWSEKNPTIVPQLTALPGVEVHVTETPGKLIMTVEANSDSELLSTITKIEKTDGVISVSLVYHQIEDDGDA